MNISKAPTSAGDQRGRSSIQMRYYERTLYLTVLHFSRELTSANAADGPELHTVNRAYAEIQRVGLGIRSSAILVGSHETAFRFVKEMEEHQEGEQMWVN